MKKIISLLVLSVLLVGLTAPGVAGAQEKLRECCLLSNNVTLNGVTCAEGSSVGPNQTAAGECGTTICTAVPASPASLSNWGMYCLVNTINSITNWLFYLLLIAVVLLGVIGGALYMTSAGDAEKAGKGKSIIVYAIIGLVLALIAKLVPSVVRLIIGM